MKLLLDSHALIWFCNGDSQLSATARTAMQDRANDIFVSYASAWEIAIKVQLGKLNLKVPYEDIFPGAIRLNGFEMLPNAVVHYHRLLNLPMHHRDPFDRLIIAQAITEEMSVVSCDSNFPAYGVPLLW